MLVYKSDIRNFAFRLGRRVNRLSRVGQVPNGRVEDTTRDFKALIELLHETPIPDLQPIVDGIRGCLESLKGEVSPTRDVQPKDTAPSGYIKPKITSGRRNSKRDQLLVYIHDNPGSDLDVVLMTIGGKPSQTRRLITNLRNNNQLEWGPRDGPYALTEAGRDYAELLKRGQEVYIVGTVSNDGVNAPLEPSEQIVPSTPPLAETSVLPKAIQLYVPSIKRGKVERVAVVTDGPMKLDAGALFGNYPKTKWEYGVTTDRKNRITLGLNSLLVQMSDGENILIDAGAGSKYRDELYYPLPSRLIKSLRELGVVPKNINKVVLTHLQSDHCGGCTRLNRVGDVIPTFPRATYYVQSLSLEEARNPSSNRSRGMYREDDFSILEAYGSLHLLNGNEEIAPGVGVVVTGGHKRGHQIVFVQYGGERVVFLGDLIPTPYHLSPNVVSAHDDYPIETERMKQQILDQALKDGWLLVFSHGHPHHAGYVLERRNEERLPQRYFKPVNLT